ncbi:MAG TPA: hypothetical protein VF411_11505 [Bacteroidia bacterium]
MIKRVFNPSSAEKESAISIKATNETTLYNLFARIKRLSNSTHFISIKHLRLIELPIEIKGMAYGLKGMAFSMTLLPIGVKWMVFGLKGMVFGLKEIG